MNYYKLANNTLTLKSGYFVSGISLLIVFFSWIFIDIFANFFKSNLSYELLKQAFYEKEYESALEISNIRLSPKISNKVLIKFFSVIPSLNGVVKKRHIPKRIISKDLQYKIFSLGPLVKDNNVKESINSITDIKRTLKKSGYLSSKNVNNALNNIDESIKNLKIENNNLKKYDSDLEDLKGKKERLKRRHHLLSEEFGIFLTLKPKSNKDGEFEVYKSGVLAGLPVLKKLPDAIDSLPKLKEELDKIGGNVNIQASHNAYEVFTARLLSIRDSSEGIRNEFNQISNEISLIEKETKETKNSIKSKQSNIYDNIKDLILALNN